MFLHNSCPNGVIIPYPVITTLDFLVSGFIGRQKLKNVFLLLYVSQPGDDQVVTIRVDSAFTA